VENLQGISWTEVSIKGQANHAGTTPMGMRRDAGACAGELAAFVHRLALDIGEPQVATVGVIELTPNIVNVVPASARVTVDLRNPDNAVLIDAERRLDATLRELERKHRVEISSKRLARFDPVTFDERIVSLVEASAESLGLSCRRMTSGAGHDAQMMSRICPTAMIFTPSINGVSHNPAEATDEADIVAGANVLLKTLLHLLDQR
jgi:N-carbamoyl-L-amino-acid hydrolase